MWKLSTKLGNHYRFFQTGVGTKVPNIKKNSLLGFLETCESATKSLPFFHNHPLDDSNILTLRKMFNTRSVQATLAISALKDETNYFM